MRATAGVVPVRGQGRIFSVCAHSIAARRFGRSLYVLSRLFLALLYALMGFTVGECSSRGHEKMKKSSCWNGIRVYNRSRVGGRD